MAEEKTEEKTGMQVATPEQVNALLSGGNINTTPPAVETPEEKKEEVPEVVTEDKGGGEVPISPPETPQEFNIEFFNKQFSTEFTDEGGIKEALKASQEIDGLKKLADTIPSKDEELEILRQEADPMKYFASEDDFRVAQFKKGFPDKDPAMVARLFSTDLSQVKDFDVLTWMTMLDNPSLDGGESGARELVADLYGIEDVTDLSALDTLTKNKLKVSAGKERSRLAEMKSGIPLPEKKDYSTIVEEKRAEKAEKLTKLTSDWKTIAGAVVKEYPDIVINDTDKDGNVTELFRYKVGQGLTDEIVQPIVEGFIRAGVPVDDKSAQALGIALQKEFIHRNKDQIIKQAVQDAVARKEEEVLQEEHNPGSPNDRERVVSGDSKSVSDKILHDLRHGGFTPKRAY